MPDLEARMPGITTFNHFNQEPGPWAGVGLSFLSVLKAARDLEGADGHSWRGWEILVVLV